MKEVMTSRFVPTNYMRNIFDKLTLLRQGVKTVDEYYMEMEMLMQRGRVRESLEMTMQRFVNGLKYDVKGIVRHYTYTNMNQLLHHAREAESQLAEEAKVKGRATGGGRFTPRAPSTAPAPSTRSAPYSTPPSKPVSNVSNAKKSESAASTSGSSMSTARNRDMLCHTCGGKGHFKRDCPNRKVMIINEDNEYETGDDVDPNAPDDDDYDTDGEDAYPSDARTIVVSQRALNVLPSASTQRCNLFQTKTLVGPDKACKVIIDGGSCRNLASKELCTKLKLKYLPHPHPYYIQWLSDNGEMKVNHMVRVEFEIGPYKDCIDFDVVPMTEFGDVFPEEVPAGLPPLRGTTRKIEDNPRELLELYRGITNDDCRTIQRGKIRNIQLPAIKYFAYYIGTSILGRENTSNISSYHLGFLIAALTGDTPYHLGALVARRLSNKGPIFGGIIASRVLAYLELPLDPNDVKIAPMRLDIAAMKSHQFVTTDSSLDKIVYRILFADGEEREILLPQPDLFSIDRKPWSRTKEEVDEQLKIQGFHQQHDSEDAEPSYDYTVTYPGASSSTYPEYDPSSYYEGASSWAPWG
ncbi:hypothetical protein QYE76_056183 [Lolium multiflorum]|uniref:CCHC-type domain-containing protein n=1 Tax=Lolium multiflorum TaxID=4521 RepID=A0AAD8T277_LOLMU|nr:hypothetical protein QYE76_056183 [Lolium multiflorum]